MWVRCLRREEPLEKGNGSPLQHSCLENSMGRGAWWATVHGVTIESDTTEQLNNNNNNKWLRTIDVYSLTVQEARSQKSSVSGAVSALSGASKADPFPASSSFWRLLLFLFSR